MNNGIEGINYVLILKVKGQGNLYVRVTEEIKGHTIDIFYQSHSNTHVFIFFTFGGEKQSQLPKNILPMKNIWS